MTQASTRAAASALSFATTQRRSASTERSPSLDRLMTLAEVMTLTSWSRSSLYRKIGEGSFPAPVKIGASRIAWRESDVKAWLSALPRAA